MNVCTRPTAAWARVPNPGAKRLLNMSGRSVCGWVDLGRRRDRLRVLPGQTCCERCGLGGWGCGALYRYDGRDPHRIDLLPVLSLEEQLQAVRDAGGIALALRRISGRGYSA